MRTFWEWLLAERGPDDVPPGVLQAYERALQDELHRLIARTQDPELRAKLLAMLDCPVRDSRGNCRSFSEYIMSALIRSGIHHRYDLEAALSYVIQQMLLDKSVATGQPRPTLFGGFDPDQPQGAEGNPLQARFMVFLRNAIRTILKGKIPRLSNAERRPQGTVSIGQGRRREGDPGGQVSPDEIAAQPSTDADLAEMIEDITALLKQKEAAYPLPLVDLFRAIMSGQRTAAQRAQFGDDRTRLGRQVIVQAIRDYAQSTGNYLLTNLLKRFEDFQGNKPMPQQRQPVKTPRPQLSDQQRDYASILSVLDRLGRPAGSADLGKYRRRWLEYPPRNATSGHRNRLEEVLAKMTQDGVVTTTRTQQGALFYSPGPNSQTYRQGVAV